MATPPRYVPSEIKKWTDEDINAVVARERLIIGSGLDWDAIAAYLGGLTASGIIAAPYSYIIRFDGVYYSAVSGVGMLTYGGSADAGGVDGTNAAEVIQAVLDDAATADMLVRFSKHEFPLDAMLTYEPTGSHTLALEGCGQGFGSTTLYRQGATASPAFYVPDSAAVNFQLNIHNLNFKSDTADFAAQAIMVDQSCALDFRNLIIRSDTLSGVPLANSVGLQLGTNINLLSGEMKILDNVWIIGYEVGFSIAADWVDIRSGIVWYSNLAAYRFENSPLKPRMSRCHTYSCGGPQLILDSRSLGTQGYVLDIDNFYYEAPAPGGFNAITAIYNRATAENRIAVQNFAAFSDYDTAVAPEYAGQKGTAHNSIQAGSGTVLMPTDTAVWNRNSWSSTPDPMLIATSYRNINMATMRVSVDIELAAASGADSYAMLGMYNEDPGGGGFYTPFYTQCRSENGMASKLRVPLEIEVPPGWWFFVNANLQTFVKGYTVTYKDYEP